MTEAELLETLSEKIRSQITDEVLKDVRRILNKALDKIKPYKNANLPQKKTGINPKQHTATLPYKNIRVYLCASASNY